MIEVPLTSDPEQLFSINLSGQIFDLRVIFNSRHRVWTADFIQNGTTIVSGVSLLGGIDIMRQYNIGVTNMFTVNIDNSNVDATSSNLGTVVKLFILTDEELSSG